MRKPIYHLIALCLLVMLTCATLPAQGLVVNEVSNGPAGTQEYMEFVVVGPASNPNCGPVDIRGWIIDDNNGDFSCGACAGTGIATGHLRFANVATWAAVPAGAIIVVYDPTVKNPKVPADDHDDTVLPDRVYILGSNDILLEASTTPCASPNAPTGVGACGSCTGNINYTGTCYTAGVANTAWGLRNAGDAAQVRRPNGTYFHGIGYGTAASLITGGPDGLMVSNLDGSTRTYSFMNTLSDDFRAVGNYTAGTVAANSETPGLPNGGNNTIWINALSLPCPLPIVYASELQGRPQVAGNLLSWSTATEINADRFEVLRSTDLSQGFSQIGTVAARGYSNSMVEYTYLDAQAPARAWYQLRLVDRDGSSNLSNTVSVVNDETAGAWVAAWPNPSSGTINLRGAMPQAIELRIIDMLGRTIATRSLDAGNDAFELQMDLSDLPSGNYLVQLRGAKGSIMRRITLDRGL